MLHSMGMIFFAVAPGNLESKRCTAEIGEGIGVKMPEHKIRGVEIFDSHLRHSIRVIDVFIMP